MKHYFNDSIGVRVEGRWTPTYVGETPEGIFCNWYAGFCAVVTEQQIMHQVDITAGVVLKF